MLANPRITGYLSRALSHELNVVQQYLTQAALCDLWGETSQAECFRRDANDELGHAGQLIRRLLTLGQLPNASQLNPVRPGRDMREMFEQDVRFEQEAVRMYAEALHYSQRFGDAETVALFAALMQEEQEHLACLEKHLAAMSPR